MRISKFLAGAALVSSLTLLGGTARAVTFDFQFSDFNTSDDVGYGTFTMATDPGDGVFALDSLGAYSASFAFGPDTFTTSDIDTSSSEVLVSLTGAPGSQSLQFSNTQPYGDGQVHGSLDLVNSAGDDMSFEPPGACDEPGSSPDCNQFQEQGSSDLAGSYTAFEASAAPEPSTWMLMMVGVGMAGVGLRRERSRLQRARTVLVI